MTEEEARAYAEWLREKPERIDAWLAETEAMLRMICRLRSNTPHQPGAPIQTPIIQR